MNKKSLLLAALTGVFLTGSAFAYTPADSAAATAPHPIASTIVRPIDLPRSFSGGVVTIEFTLDPAGQPREIQVRHVSDPVVKRQIVAAFRQWRFEAGAGSAISATKRFVLPIELHTEEA